MKRIGLLILIILSAIILSGCENLSFEVKYGDWGFKKEIKLKDIKNINIEVQPIKDQVQQDLTNPNAPLVAPLPTNTTPVNSAVPTNTTTY